MADKEGQGRQKRKAAQRAKATLTLEEPYKPEALIY